MPQHSTASTAEHVLSAVEACLDAASAGAPARLRAPADRCTEGQLTEDGTLVRLGNFVCNLQARALSSGSGRARAANTEGSRRRRRSA